MTLNNKGNALAKLLEQTATNNIKPAYYHYSQSLFDRTYRYDYASFYNNIAIISTPPNYGSYTQLVQIYDTALAIDPNAMDVLSNKGIVLTKLGYYTEAIKIFDKILSMDGNNVAGLYNKGTCLDKLGHHIQAKDLHDKALKIDPNYTGDFQNRVALVSKLSKSQEASTFAPAL